MALRRLSSYESVHTAAARRRLAILTLEDRVTPSFSGLQPMSADVHQVYTESRADLYQPQTVLPASETGAEPALTFRNGFTPLRIDIADLTAYLADAPQENETGPTKILALPRPDGTFDRFNVWEVQLMEPGLAAQYPEIRTWRGQGIDDPTAVLAADVTRLGFHAQVRSPNGGWYVDPYYHLETDVYAAYGRGDLENKHGPGCTCAACLVPQGLVREEPPPTAGRPTYGQTLREYRTAVAATGEYTQFHGGSVANGQAAIVTAINRVSGVYETELSLRLILVGNNSSLVFTNPGSDPYSNGDAFAMLGENQIEVDATIGSANYDLGHVFGTDSGGVAFLGVVGEDGFKAQGVTGSGAPIGDAFYIDYVAHEMGHQFSGNHTFNGVEAGSNRNGPTAYEPGSGSTIMAYAGIMGPDDLQGFSDPYFHFESLNEISDYTFSGNGAGFNQTPTANAIPTADAGPDRAIPAGTYFALTGIGTDANPGDVLTYNWEQYDLGGAQALGSSDNGSSPLFRSFTATTNPTRFFPRLPIILANGTSPQEILPTRNWGPSAAAQMTFNLTVRDNRVIGAYASDQVNIQVVNTGAPFQITSFNTGGSFTGGTTQTLTWNVAGTAVAPISAATVDILMSDDGGNTFTIVLASAVPNDGSESIVLPNIADSQVRFKVQPTNNIFFDVSNANITIQPAASVTGVSSTLANGTYGAGQVIPVTVTFSGAVNVNTAGGTPSITLNSGGTATYASGGGSSVLTFNYTVANGENSADLDYTTVAALALNGGAITAVSNGGNAQLQLPAPGLTGSLGANKNIIVGTEDIASVGGVTSPASNGTYVFGAVVPITVTFDRAVAVTGLPQIALNSGGTAVYASGSGTATLTFNYTVGVLDTTSDLDYASTGALALNGGTIQSPITGDDAILDLPAPGGANSLGGTKDITIGDQRITLDGATLTVNEGVGVYSVMVNRAGGGAGTTSIDFAVTAGTAKEGIDYTVLTPAGPLIWIPGETDPIPIEIQIINDALSEGRETLSVALSNLDGPAGLGIDSAVLTIPPSDGLPPGVFTAADWDKATIKLVTPRVNGGSLVVFLTDGQLPVSLLQTTGTNPLKSIVSMTVRKARTSTDLGTVAVGGVEGSGLKSLNLVKSQIGADGIRLDGMLASLRVDSIADGGDVVLTGTPVPKRKTAVFVKNGVGNGVDFTLPGPVSSFNVGSFGDGKITAPSIGTLRVRANFGGDVTLSGAGVQLGKPALQTVNVTGEVNGSDLDVSGYVGSVTVGSFVNSHLYAGYNGTQSGVGTFPAFYAINSFKTTNKLGMFKDSSVIAWTVRTVTLARVDGQNASDKFGVYAQQSIRKVIVKDPAHVYDNPFALTGFDDFEVAVVQ